MDLGDLPWYGMPDSGVLSVKGDNTDKALSAAGNGVCEVITNDRDLFTQTAW